MIGTSEWCCDEFFFLQAEDGIRDYKVTGVQTCALPICLPGGAVERCRGGATLPARPVAGPMSAPFLATAAAFYGAAWEARRRVYALEIGRASCRERV